MRPNQSTFWGPGGEDFNRRILGKPTSASNRGLVVWGVSEHSWLQLDKVQSRALWSDSAPLRSRRGEHSFCIIRSSVWHRLTHQCKELWDGYGFQLWMPRLTTLKKAPLCQSISPFIRSCHYNFSCSSVCRQTRDTHCNHNHWHSAWCWQVVSVQQDCARCLGSDSCRLSFLGIQFWFWTVYFQFWGQSGLPHSACGLFSSPHFKNNPWREEGCSILWLKTISREAKKHTDNVYSPC